MCFCFVLWDCDSSCFFTVPLSDAQSEPPDVEPRTFTAVGELLWYYCSPVSGSLTWQLLDLILLWLHPNYHLIPLSYLSLDMRYHFLQIPASFCQWLFSSEFWFWCSCRKWAHILLLLCLELEVHRNWRNFSLDRVVSPCSVEKWEWILNKYNM